MTRTAIGLWRSTAAALVTPRRLLPIALVSIPLLVAQATTSSEPFALPLGALIAACLFVVAPVAWRRLFPLGQRVELPLARLAGYGAIGASALWLVGMVIPNALQLSPTFMTQRSSLPVELALFLVAGWGLGRDIDVEARMDRERARIRALEREAERAQLLALRSHLDPHFLFNTLNAIAEWCREDGETAERAILQLSRVLRLVLEGVRQPSWPLARELELVEMFLSLHQIRDPARFAIEQDALAAPRDVETPPLILLPLAENAVKHGPAAGHRGTIHVGATVRGDALLLRVENPGPFAGPRPGGHGLDMVRRRLALAYDDAATLHVASVGDDRTCAEIAIPLARTRPEVNA